MTNIKEIKNKYNCLNYLGAPVKKTAHGFLFRAPWRTDTHPSLSVTANGKGWHDLATGEHGSIIDLVMRCLNTTDIRQVCDEIKRMDPTSFSFSQPSLSEGEENTDGGFVRFEVVKLQSKALFAYLYSRKVNLLIARQFVKEAHYNFEERTDGRYLYALAYPNNLGGYELRGAPYSSNPNGFKGGTSPKGITTHWHIEGAPVIVFEGFMDMLSFATLCGEVRHNYVVLNSTSMKEEAIEALKPLQNKILLCLDNDEGGERATRMMLDALPSAIDIRGRFAPSKDVNEYLCSNVII